MAASEGEARLRDLMSDLTDFLASRNFWKGEPRDEERFRWHTKQFVDAKVTEGILR